MDHALTMEEATRFSWDVVRMWVEHMTASIRSVCLSCRFGYEYLVQYCEQIMRVCVPRNTLDISRL